MRVTGSNYRSNKLYPRIVRAVAEIRKRSDFVAPIDVLVSMGLLHKDRLLDWRRGRVPFLERVIDCNLSRLSRLLHILSFHARDLGLAPSVTVYKRWGKGPKQTLRFSKTGDPGIEKAYSSHFVRRGKGKKPPPGKKKDERKPPE